MQIKANTKHLLERANRVLSHHNHPQPSPQLSRADLIRWIAVIKDNCPEDWRFSENPKGEFLLTVERDGAQLKFLGRSSRATRNWNRLQESVFALALSARPEPTEQEVVRLARLYLREQCSDRGEIFHELKTVFSGRMIPSSAKRYGTRMEEAHMSVLNGSQADKNLARRPNAILIDRNGTAPELFVRQGQPYLRASSRNGKSNSFCIFAKLGKRGIESGSGQLWKISSGGAAYNQGIAECWPTPTPALSSLPSGFRTYSYWQVPLKLDVLRDDLCFRVKKDQLDETSEASGIIRVIDLIRDKARELSQVECETGECETPLTASATSQSTESMAIVAG